MIITVGASREHLDAVVALGVSAHERARRVEPRLGPWATDAAGSDPESMVSKRLLDLDGTVALRDGAVAGVWLAAREPTVRVAPLWGVVGDLDAIRAAYAAQAGAWMYAGQRTHTVVVRAADRQLHDGLVDLGFGHEQAFGVLDVQVAATGRRTPMKGEETPSAHVVIRPATSDDLDDIVRLAPIIGRHQVASPVFARVGEEFFDQLAAAHTAKLADPDAHYLIAHVAGDAVGFALWYEGQQGPFVPVSSVELSVASTAEWARGRGVGLALTAAVVDAARAHGSRYVAADWRTTNLLSSRFWPARGFRVVGHRMARTIDPDRPPAASGQLGE